MHAAWLPTRGLSVRIAAVVISSLAITVVAALPLADASNTPARSPAGASGSKPAITLSPTSGPVGTAVQVSGTGFKHRVTVDISFDSTLVATAVTSRKGSFPAASFQVPAAAAPGNHLVTAQATSDPAKTASATFIVIGVNWPKFHHDLSLTGFDPSEALLGPGNVSSLSTRWTQATGNGVESSPAVVDGHVYIGSDDGGVYNLDATTGAVIWETLTGGAVTSSPAVTASAVYVGSGDGKVYDLDPVTGVIRWDTLTGGNVSSSPAVTASAVYVGSGDGKVYDLDPVTGVIRWDTLTGGNVSSSPGVANGVVYVGSSDGNLYALNAATGAVAWKGATGGIIDSSPAVASGVVYVGSADNNVYAYSLS
jgi:outer membrane protein assembly factor BamB